MRRYRSEAERNLWHAAAERMQEAGMCRYDYVGIVRHRPSLQLRRAAVWLIGFSAAALLAIAWMC